MLDKSLWFGRPGSTVLQPGMLAIAGLLPLHTRLSRGVQRHHRVPRPAAAHSPRLIGQPGSR